MSDAMVATVVRSVERPFLSRRVTGAVVVAPQVMLNVLPAVRTEVAMGV